MDDGRLGDIRHHAEDDEAADQQADQNKQMTKRLRWPFLFQQRCRRQQSGDLGLAFLRQQSQIVFGQGDQRSHGLSHSKFGQNFVGRASVRHLSPIHENDLVGETQVARPLGHHEHGGALAQLFELAHEGGVAVAVQCPTRFVKQENGCRLT
ncbi:MAG: hypothetical protein HC814_06910 [Rhodobacteraceae bacterium]|nr:hypothetical protein [Paracoccaceae bacterium]